MQGTITVQLGPRTGWIGLRLQYSRRLLQGSQVILWLYASYQGICRANAPSVWGNVGEVLPSSHTDSTMKAGGR